MKQATADPITMAYHELRGPLGLMATAARSAAEDCTDESLRARCQVIVRAAERMLRTAGQVIELAQSSQPICSQVFDPVETIRSTIEDLNAMDVPVHLTELIAEGECGYEGSVEQLEALVQSLISNACDHAEPGSSIHVVISKRFDHLRVEFVNQRALVRRHNGLGLGTYIGQSLARQLGGHLECEARGNEFSSVLTLPLAQARTGIAP